MCVYAGVSAGLPHEKETNMLMGDETERQGDSITFCFGSQAEFHLDPTLKSVEKPVCWVILELDGMIIDSKKVITVEVLDRLCFIFF